MTWTKNYLNQLDEGNQKAPWMRSVNNQSFQQNSSDLLLNDFLPSIKANLVSILIQSQSLTSMLNLLEAPHRVNFESYITRHTWLGHACILPNNFWLLQCKDEKQLATLLLNIKNMKANSERQGSKIIKLNPDLTKVVNYWPWSIHGHNSLQTHFEPEASFDKN